MKTKKKNRKKNPYSPPRLVAYGDFRKLTKTGKGGTKGDGVGPPQNKTGLTWPRLIWRCDSNGQAGVSARL